MLPYKSSSLVQNVFAVYRFAQGAADWRSGPRWSATSMLYLVHPFASSRHFPSRGNEGYEEKTGESYTSCTIPAFPPFGGWRHNLSPASGGTITRAYCRDIYEESDSRCFILLPLAGEVPRSGKGGDERSEPITECLSCHVIQKANPVTLTLYSSPCGRYRNPRGQRPRQT